MGEQINFWLIEHGSNRVKLDAKNKNWLRKGAKKMERVTGIEL